ncbi:MAG: hypothetical protein KC547_17430, partial [Anaerolineae bacterium]|nr:hypothetical protein [Anaerolineae bacterium]
IELVAAIAGLSQAQISADGGDTGAALQTIESVQAQLDTIVSACGRATIPERIYISPDKSFAFAYPESWSRLSPTAGVYALSNDQRVLSAAIDSNLGDPLAPGSVIVVVGILDIEDYLSSGGSFDEFVAEFQDEGINSTLDFVGATRTPEFGRYEMRATNIQSDSLEGVIYYLNPAADGKVIVVIGLTPRGEYEPFTPEVNAVAASVRYGADVAEAQAAQASPATPTIVEQPQPPGRPLADITYASAISLTDFNADINVRSAMLSPDGSMIGWHTPQSDGLICVYTFADGQTVCSTVPEIFRGAPQYIIWSPDSRYITFSQDFILRFEEADIWLYEVETRRFINATDDQIDRWSPVGGTRDDNVEGPLWIDLAFTWGPDLNLYFYRTELPDPSTMDLYTVGIYRQNPATGETVLIRDITEDFERFSIYQNRELEFNGSIAVSPDAQQIAMIVLEHDLDSPKSGIWVMPANGSEAPQQLVAASDLTAGLVTGALQGYKFAVPMGLAWSPDGRSLYTLGTTVYTGTLDGGAVIYQIDTGTAEITPLNDFSAYDRETLYSADDNGHVPAFYVPRGAVMSSDGTTPLTLHAFENQGGLSALRVVDGALQPELLVAIDDFRPIPASVSSAARDGKLLLWGYLFLPGE